MTSNPIVDERGQRDELASAILRRRDDIIHRWLAKVQSDLERASAALSLTELPNAMPDYLDGLAAALQSKSVGPSVEMRGTEAWVEVAKEHAITRVCATFADSPS